MVEPLKNPAPPRRLWKVVLVCSLALNLAVAGVVAGTLWSGRGGDRPPRSFDLGVGPVAQALDARERRAVGRELRQARVLRDLDPRGRAAEMVAVLQAEPFDPDALRALFQRQSADLALVQTRAQEALVSAITAMTPERRAAFATAIADGAGRGLGPRDASAGN